MLQQAEYREANHIRRLYRERSENFDETLRFLRVVSGGGEGEDGATIDVRLPSGIEETVMKSWLLSCLVNSDSPYRRVLFSYLQAFAVEEGEPRYRPEIPLRHYESDVRNFLIELEVIGHNVNDDFYFVKRNQIELFLVAQDWAHPKQAPSRRARVQLERESLGAAAEGLVLEYERNRLGEAHQDGVEHVALFDSGAGYDIRSLTLDGTRISPRFIEVKAVPRGSLRFYWTRNEMQTSQRFGEWYYLYLLPVSGKGQLLLGELVVIRNPTRGILESEEKWEVEPDVVQCRKLIELESGRGDGI